MWWSRKTPPVPPDVAEAQQIRAEAQQDLRNLKRQASYVAELAARLVERRAENHFGDDIQITFVPRGRHG